MIKNIPVTGETTKSYLIDNSGNAQNAKDPSFQTAAYRRMAKFWTLVEDVYAGTLAMRQPKNAKKYLPQWPMESDAAYKSRVSIVTLMNAYARTVDAMVGLVVGSGIKLKNLPDSIKPHVKNIDNAGTTFEVFGRDSLRDAFDGHSVILIDMPDVAKPTDRVEARKRDIRPYWVRRKASDVPNWRTEVIDGKTVVQQLTVRECVVVPDGEFGEREEMRYLRWQMVTTDTPEGSKRIARWSKYSEYKDANGIRKFKKLGSGDTHLTRIPVVVIYGYQEEGKILESKPPLIDLAFKNLEHMQIDSDYKKGLSIAGMAVPVITSKKTASEIEQIFGWDVVMVLDEDEKFQFVEANGNALPNKRLALEDIKREMGVLGLSLIAERADANITATERLLDSVQQSNQLMAIQASFLMAMRHAFEIHCEWMKIELPENFEVALGLDWTEIVRSADHMQLLLEMAKEDFLSVTTLLEAAGQYGVLPNYVDPKEEEGRLKAEGRVRVSRMEMKSTSTGVQVADTQSGNSSSSATSVKSPTVTGSTGDNNKDSVSIKTSLNTNEKSKEA